MTHRHAAPNEPVSDQTERQLGEIIVARNLLKLRFCIICHNEMTDEICCTCEAPTVLKTSA
jgi:hypothetical protein